MSDDALSKLRTFSGVNGREVLLNVSNEYVVIRDPGLAGMRESLARFRLAQLRWLRSFLLAESGKTNAAGHPVVEGLTGSVGRVKQARFAYFIGKRLNFMQAPPSAWAVLEGAGLSAQPHPSFLISHADLSLQRGFMAEAIGDDVTVFAKVVVANQIDCLCYPALEAILGSSSSVPEFIARVEERAEYERQPLSVLDRHADPHLRNRVKSAIPDGFLFWLSQEGVLLRPVRPRVFVTDTRGLDVFLMAEGIPELWEASKSTFRALSNRNFDVTISRTQRKNNSRWERDLASAFFVTISSSTIRSIWDISDQLFSELFMLFDSQVASTHITNCLSMIFRAMHDLLPKNTTAPLFKSNRRSVIGSDRFAWTRMTYAPETRARFPDGFVGPYHPRENLIAWVDAFEEVLPQVETKSSGSWYSTINAFLSWLALSNRSASHVSELVRDDINDGRSVGDNSCFRAFLIRRGSSADNVSGNMSRLAALFDYMIDGLPNRIPNPVVVRFDMMKAPFRRGKTPRRALGRDMLEFIRELNARDDFTFSRSKSTHYRTLYDRETGTYQRIWFPGVACIVDLLLRLPLRGFQARFLDSGEGDEFVPDLDSRDLGFKRNPNTHSTKGRRQGVLTIVSGLRAEPLLGLYVNTNKTAVDRETGYEIPWCEDGLRDSLRSMACWQQRWNPISAPVLCIDRNRLPTNPDVTAAIPSSYPLFRDPADHEGWPISRDLIYRYWDELCAAVEDDLASRSDGERRIRMTDEVIEDKGSGKTHRRRVARYDIHTLRVSGISALIEAGMPPDLVQQVAGHSAVVMTLYYNVIAASKLNERLQSALLRSAVDMDALDALRDDDFDRVSEYLVNTRAADDAVGLSMLRERIGHGAGDFDVMSHGICPGGLCSSGGAWANQAVGHLPVARPMACSLCRYRLTGPMFLPGLARPIHRTV